MRPWRDDTSSSPRGRSGEVDGDFVERIILGAGQGGRIVAVGQPAGMASSSQATDREAARRAVNGGSAGGRPAHAEGSSSRKAA